MKTYQAKVARNGKAPDVFSIADLAIELRDLSQKGNSTRATNPESWADSKRAIVSVETDDPQRAMSFITERGYSIVYQKITDNTKYRDN